MSNVTSDIRAPSQTLVSRALRVAWSTFLVLVGLGIVISLVVPANYHPEGDRRRQCRYNLKDIGLALHSYHDKYACFPPAFVSDEQGRRMHSWRVLLLPFLGKADLYEQYHFDEPWDGPNNCRLHDTIVPVYNCPSETHALPDRASTSTNYVAVIGPETAWPGESSGSFSRIKDGTSMTLLIVEVANSGIHWMEPRDLHVIQMAPTINAKSGQGIASRHEGGAHCLFADGSIRFFPSNTSVEELQALLTAHAGDSPGDF